MKDYLDKNGQLSDEVIKLVVATSVDTDNSPFKFIRLHGPISFPNNKDSGHQKTISLVSHTQSLKDGDWRVIPQISNKRYFSEKSQDNFYGELKDALELIKEATKIIIIGYSFQQSDFIWGLNFYKAISQNRNNPEIEVVNPAFKKHGGIASNYLQVIPSKYMKNVKFFPYKFEEFLRL